MKKWIWVLTMSMVCVAGSVRADVINLSVTNTARLYTTAQDGSGNTVVEGVALNVGTKSNGAGWDMHAGFAFLMTGASAADLAIADFSVSITGGQGTMGYNTDVYVNRVSSTDTFLASDFENGTKIMDDFTTTATDDIGTFHSLDVAGQTNLLTYLENNWVEGEYLILTIKSDQADFIMGEDLNANIIFSSADAELSVATGQLVFSEDFNGQALSHTDSAPIIFGGASPEVTTGEWFSAANGVAINNELQLTNFNLDKTRGAGIWLDSSGWAIGTVTVTFDVLDYVAGGENSESFFQAYYANGVDASSSVSMDLHGAGGADPIIASSGGATIGTIGARNAITGNVTNVEFTFDFTGQENIALVFYNAATLNAMPVYSVDNLTAILTPAPSALSGTVILIL